MKSRPRAILILGAACGLLVGIMEGVGLLVFQELGWLNFSMALYGVSVEILWISPAFNLLLFGLLGAGFATLAWWGRQWPVSQWAFFLMTFLGFYDWVALSGRIRSRLLLLPHRPVGTVPLPAFHLLPLHDPAHMSFPD